MASGSDTFTLAKKAHQSGDLVAAERLYQRAAAEQPANAHVRYLLGAAYDELKRLEDAATNLQAALRLNPRHAPTHNHLGKVLAQQEKFDEAAASFREAIRIDPAYAEAYRNLAEALTSIDKLTEAIAAAEQALRIKPDFAEAHRTLAETLVKGGLFDRALVHAQKAVALKPEAAKMHIGLAKVLRRLRRNEEGIAALEQARRLEPAAEEIQYLLGAAYIDGGDFERAVGYLRETLRLAPDHSAAYHLLGRIARQKKYSFTDAETAIVRKLLAESESQHAQSMFHFTLAYVLEGRGSYDEAFQHYQLGNDCYRQFCAIREHGYDYNTQRRNVDDLIAFFDRGLFTRMAGVGHSSDLPVFIVGMPRSGTSLVEQILSSHPRFAGAGELQDIEQIKLDLPAALKTARKYPAWITDLTASAIRPFTERYLQRLQREDPQALRVSDKMPGNYMHLGLIAVLFPHAHIIHCRRDPRDICLSCFCEHFESVRFAESLEDLGHCYGEYERLMAHWRQVLPLPIYEVRYEKLVAEQEAVSRELVAFCGLDWHDDCLHFHDTRRPVQTASNVQVRQPIYSTSIGRWKRYQNHLGPLLELLQPFL